MTTMNDSERPEQSGRDGRAGRVGLAEIHGDDGQGAWARVLTERDVTRDRPRTVKLGDKQIALFRDDDGALHAIDNRCPHEGYPLSTGALREGVLTCEWHNWKFRLCDGVCVLGGEDVRRYPLRVEDGAVWLDLADPPGDAQIPRYLASLDDAFDELDWGHAARTVERLLAVGAEPAAILAHACTWGARRAPYGFDHGLAAAADLAAVLPEHADEPTVPLMQAISLIVEPNVRRPIREIGATETVVSDGRTGWDAVEDELRRRIEAEDLAGAEGLVRGALAAGAGPDELFAWLTHAATDHFLGFGHPHIYCVKAEELLAVIGWEHAEPILVSLVAAIVYDTREDRLPYMKPYRREIERYADRFAERGALPDPDPDAPFDAGALIDAVVGDGADGESAGAGGAPGRPLGDALAGVAAALDARVAPDRVAAALALAAAHRLLRFDPSLEASDDAAEDWLTITHSLTHADAVRESLRRRHSAALLRGLFHSARFVHHLAPCDLPAEARAGAASEARAIADEMAGGDLGGALRRIALSDRATRPIFVAHFIKATEAARRIADALAADPVLAARGDDRDLTLVAVARFMSHPLQERRITRSAKVARRFVREGEMQIKRLGY